MLICKPSSFCKLELGGPNVFLYLHQPINNGSHSRVSNVIVRNRKRLLTSIIQKKNMKEMIAKRNWFSVSSPMRSLYVCKYVKYTFLQYNCVVVLRQKDYQGCYPGNIVPESSRENVGENRSYLIRGRNKKKEKRHNLFQR